MVVHDNREHSSHTTTSRDSLVVKADEYPAGSSSTTSSSTTTPRTMSNNNAASETLIPNPALPASTREPAMNTINPAAAPFRPSESKGPSSATSEGSQKGPPSINMNEVQEGVPPIPGTISGPSQSQASSGRPRRHRRIQSDNVPRADPTLTQQGQYYYPSPSVQHMQAQQDGSYIGSGSYNGGSYSPGMNPFSGSGQPPPMGPPPHLPRARAMSGSGPFPVRSQYAMPSSPQADPHGMSPRSGRMPLGRQQSERGTRSHRTHRKSVSWSAAAPGQSGYGAFWNGDDGDAMGIPVGGYPSPSQRPPASPSQNFSPRGELMTLASSFRDPSEMSPRQSQSSPRNHYAKGAPTTPDMRFSQSPGTPMSLPSPYGGGVGGEQYLTHKRSKSESSRKMQLRQHSAQLFMEDVKGVEQPALCRDVIFLLLFVFHLIFLVFLGHKYGKDALENHEPATDADAVVTIYVNNLVYLACLSGGFAIVVSAMLLAVMTFFARHFVQVALIFVITLSFIWGTLGIGLSPKNVVPITGIIALALSVAYAFIVWDRIPFASANLLTALNGVYAFPGTVGVAFIFQALALGWSVYYAIVLAGIYDAIKEGKLELSYRWEITAYVLMGISYYWTFQVFANAVQAATAGVIRSWWNAPDGEAVVRGSAFKTVFYSMGSICFGSLFVGPVRIICLVAAVLRPHPDDASLMCIYECLHCIQTCITSCVDSLADRFNPWAFMFVGMYGYGFMEAGVRATDVFDRRGWATIVSDDLVPNILLITSLVIGGITGCFAHLIEQMTTLHVMSLDEPGLVSFWVGSCVGLVLASVLFSVISGAMNAVLVCFATTPLDFEANHPDLSHEMRAAWREVWPGALDILDLHDGVVGYHPEDGRPLLA